MSNEENPEQPHGQPDPYAGWEPTPQGGEYDAEATAFVHLPPEDLANLGGVPLAAPGHSYVPPMILPLTPAAGLDPAATGSWVVQTPGRQDRADAGHPEPAPEAVHWPDPNSTHGAYQEQHPDTSQYGQTSSTTAQWHFSGAESAAPSPEPVPEPLGHTGQWTIPVADGDLPEESGEYAASATASQWYADAPPATLPGGAPAPWAAPEPAPAPQEPAAAAGHGFPGPAEQEAGEPEAAGADVPGSGTAGDTSGEDPDGTRGYEPDVPGGPEDPVTASTWDASASHGDPFTASTRDASAEAADEASEESVEETAEGVSAVPADEAFAAPVGGAPAEHGGAGTPGDAPEPAAAPGEAPTDAAEAPAPPESGDDASGTPDAVPGTPATPAPALIDVPSEHPAASYVLHVNGVDRPVADAWIGESLLYVLRERLGLAGAKDGCSQGECGACNVQVDGRLVASCLVPAATAAGSEVRTVEGLAVDGEPSDVQRALADCGAVQCGFCIPGMAMTVHDLLEGNHAPTELETRQALCGNLCRCSGYRGVLDAVREVVAGREATAEAASADDEPRIPHQAAPGAGGVQHHAHEGDPR
ncbi:2Fe-2S iron-sulfur cluster-binding protein [Streptomyces sp. NPDC005899]|uniref:2Fe-2S iron-sulfur cluster-binding protein n=1 Tax=Streptomyces sp. NPDC005899 TaxID=3155716 RepID=UPI0034007379